MISRDELVLVGHPVDHSLSPVMHNAALDAAGIALRYEVRDVRPDELIDTLDQLSAMNCGGNITMPHKRAAMGSMDAVTTAAATAGAVNTFWTDGDGHIAGDNTDVAGFAALAIDIMEGIPRNCRIAVLGAGGSAAAVLAAAQGWEGCRATVHARSAEQAAELCRRFSDFARAAPMSDPAIAAADIVINATPVGLNDDSQPLDLATVAPTAAIIDLVYTRAETAWVRNARARGHRASDGLPMLVQQGVLSFRKWFGVDPDKDAMWAAVLKESGRARNAHAVLRSR